MVFNTFFHHSPKKSMGLISALEEDQLDDLLGRIKAIEHELGKIKLIIRDAKKKKLRAGTVDANNLEEGLQQLRQLFQLSDAKFEDMYRNDKDALEAYRMQVYLLSRLQTYFIHLHDHFIHWHSDHRKEGTLGEMGDFREYYGELMRKEVNSVVKLNELPEQSVQCFDHLQEVWVQSLHSLSENAERNKFIKSYYDRSEYKKRLIKSASDAFVRWCQLTISCLVTPFEFTELLPIQKFEYE